MYTPTPAAPVHCVCPTCQTARAACDPGPLANHHDDLYDLYVPAACVVAPGPCPLLYLYATAPAGR